MTVDAWLRQRRRWLGPAVVVVAIVPIVVATVRALARGWVAIGDDGLLLLRTQDVATANHPLLGTWTSASLSAGRSINNPGPLWFDALAPFVKVAGPSVGFAVGVMVANIAAVVLAAWAARRVGGELAMVLVTALSAGLAWSMGSELLYDAWQPHAMLLPFWALLILLWALAAGQRVDAAVGPRHRQPAAADPPGVRLRRRHHRRGSDRRRRARRPTRPATRGHGALASTARRQRRRRRAGLDPAAHRPDRRRGQPRRAAAQRQWRGRRSPPRPAHRDPAGRLGRRAAPVVDPARVQRHDPSDRRDHRRRPVGAERGQRRPARPGAGRAGPRRRRARRGDRARLAAARPRRRRPRCPGRHRCRRLHRLARADAGAGDRAQPPPDALAVAGVGARPADAGRRRRAPGAGGPCR